MCATCGCGNNEDGSGHVHIEGDHAHPPVGSLPFAMPAVRQLRIRKLSQQGNSPLSRQLLSQQSLFQKNLSQKSLSPKTLSSKTLAQKSLTQHQPADHDSLLQTARPSRRMLTLEQNILAKNDEIAAENRQQFASKAQLVINLVSSPGSGKTTLLTESLIRLKHRLPCAVIEGDQQTIHDAERIRATGTPAIQVNTGTGCHLDAQMIQRALPRLALAEHGLLFIENVGNLVCPAGFDLGERHKVVVLSVTEGEDKPLKYPHMFAAASLLLLNKVDLLPHLNFDLQYCLSCARQVNPDIAVILTSATTGEGLDQWLNWLNEQRVDQSCV